MVPRIFKGDDTDANGRTVEIQLPDEDMAGFRMRFEFLGRAFEFDELPRGGSVRVDFGADDTAMFPLGTHYGTIRLQKDGRWHTVSNTVPVTVSDEVGAVYGGDAAAIHLEMTFHSGIPDLTGINDSPSNANELARAFKALLDTLKGSALAIAFAMLIPAFGAGVDVKTERAGTIDFDAEVVTDVTFDPSGLVKSEDIADVVREDRLKSMAWTNANYVASVLGIVTPFVDEAFGDKADKSALEAHVSDTKNPHKVTAAQVGALPTSGGTLTGSIEVAGAGASIKKAGKEVATEADLLAFYYPDGGVTSMDQITTSGIEYAVGEDGGAYVVKGEGLTGHVVLPWKVTIGGAEYKVTAIGERAFSGSNSFNSFTAPMTVKSIEGYAFFSCSSLASVNLPSATNIGSVVFASCGSLASVNLPSATSIGGNAFFSCHSLASVDLHSATSIGSGVFASCSSLATVDFGSSPKSVVPVLGEYAFESVPTSCRFIIPLGMYDEWVSAPVWSELYAAGYKFEGYASTEQLADNISADNPAFSNAVLSVGLNIDTNSVAVLNEIAETFGGFPIEGTATTVGGLLAALAAAVAWLRKNKADKATTLAGYGITDAATKTELAALTAKVEYPLYSVPSTGLLKDRAINTTSLATVTVPDNFTDLLIRASVASSLAVTMPAAITKYGDTFPGEAGEYLITITKTGAAEAYVRTIKLEVANA